MTTEQILWGMITISIGVIIVLFKIWMNGLKVSHDKLEIKLESKLDKDRCEERYSGVQKGCNDLAHHKHTLRNQDGTGGEVYIP